MPRIPLIREGQQTTLPRLRGQAIDNVRRPRVDRRNEMQALGQLGNAQRGAFANANAFAAEGLALAEIGKAVAQTGTVIGAVAIKKKEAETDIQISEAGSKMEDLRSDFEAWKLDNPDPAKWEGQWQTMSSSLRTQLQEREGLNRRASHEIGLRMTQFDAQQASHVQIGAAKETFKRAAGAFGVEIQKAIKSQNRTQFDALVQTGLAKGYFYEHDLEAFDSRYAQEGKVQLFKHIDTQRHASPFTMVARLEANEFNLTPEENRQQIQFTKQLVREKRFEISSRISDQIAHEDPNQRPTAEQISQLGVNLRPTTVAALKDGLAAANARTADARLRTPEVQEYWHGQVNSMMSLYDPIDQDEEYDDDFVRIQGAIENIKDPHARAEFNRQLKAIQQGNLDEVDERALGAMAQLNQEYEKSIVGMLPEVKTRTRNVRQYLNDGFLRDPAKLVSLGFSQKEAEFITEGIDFPWKDGEEPAWASVSMTGRLMRLRMTWDGRENGADRDQYLDTLDRRKAVGLIPPDERNDEHRALMEKYPEDPDEKASTFRFDMQLARELVDGASLDKVIFSEEISETRIAHDLAKDKQTQAFGVISKGFTKWMQEHPRASKEEIDSQISKMLKPDKTLAIGQRHFASSSAETPQIPEPEAAANGTPTMWESSRWTREDTFPGGIPLVESTAEDRTIRALQGGGTVILGASDKTVKQFEGPVVLIPNDAPPSHRLAAKRWASGVADLHNELGRKVTPTVKTYREARLPDSNTITAEAFSRHDEEFIEHAKTNRNRMQYLAAGTFSRVPHLALNLADPTSKPTKQDAVNAQVSAAFSAAGAVANPISGAISATHAAMEEYARQAALAAAPSSRQLGIDIYQNHPPATAPVTNTSQPAE